MIKNPAKKRDKPNVELQHGFRNKDVAGPRIIAVFQGIEKVGKKFFFNNIQ